MAENGDRITVSRETLRAELTALKLDLIQSLASKVEVDRLNDRVGSIEMHGSPALVTALTTFSNTQRDVEALKRWRWLVTGGLVFLTFLEPAAVAAVLHYL